MIPQRRSSAIYERLLRGEATAGEYCEAVRREARETVRAFRRKHTPYDTREIAVQVFPNEGPTA